MHINVDVAASGNRAPVFSLSKYSAPQFGWNRVHMLFSNERPEPKHGVQVSGSMEGSILSGG